MTELVPYRDGLEHLLAELEWLDHALRIQVVRLRATTSVTPDEFRGLYVSDEQVDTLLGARPRHVEGGAPNVAELRARLNIQRAQNRAREGLSVQASVDLPLVRLARLFGLNEFERAVVLVAFAPEFDLRYETLYAYAQNDITKKRPSVELALQLLTDTLADRVQHRHAFDLGAPLSSQEIVRLFDDPQEHEPPLLARLIKLDTRIAGFLFGQPALDPRLQAFTMVEHGILPLQQLPLSDSLRDLFERALAQRASHAPFYYFRGAPGSGRHAIALALSDRLGMPLLTADLAQMRGDAAPLPSLCRALVREARLRGAALYLSHYDALYLEAAPPITRMDELWAELSASSVPLLVGGERAWHNLQERFDVAPLTFELTVPTYELSRTLWTEAVSSQAIPLEDPLALDAVSSKFHLTPGQIRAAAARAAETACLHDPLAPAISTSDLHSAARGQSAQALGQLAQKIEPRFTWQDIVLPAGALQQLREILASIKHRHTVYSTWGMGHMMVLGLGLKILFAGPSGTGKTMSAEILANELQLDLYKIDLSTVVSKYIGETEKNLSTIFRAAQASNALLFFDEADALFGKRSEVKDAHDRYANIEVAYLLQKMDEHDGAVILATNLNKNIDEAFLRRMHHTVEFPFPDAPQRERIWRKLFPPQAPLGNDIDFTFLASRFELAGGSIRNIALAAAFNAADNGKIIDMTHLLRATAREQHKLGKRPSRAEFGDYFDVLREPS